MHAKWCLESFKPFFAFNDFRSANSNSSKTSVRCRESSVYRIFLYLSRYCRCYRRYTMTSFGNFIKLECTWLYAYANAFHIQQHSFEKRIVFDLPTKHTSQRRRRKEKLNEWNNMKFKNLQYTRLHTSMMSRVCSVYTNTTYIHIEARKHTHTHSYSHTHGFRQEENWIK